MVKNRNYIYSKYDYLKAGQVFHKATKEHFIIWLLGELQRHGRTEVMLPRLVRKKKLIAIKYGKRLVYTVPRRGRNPKKNVEHGLGCTEGLVRFWRSNMEGTIIPERKFKGFKVIPEWGIRYDNNGNRKLLLYEFCTADNFYRSGNVQGKITRYNYNLPRIESKFGGKGIVVFVIDAPRWDVYEYVCERLPIGSQFFFTDYKTFLYQPIGEQLIAPIYMWGNDSFPYPLEEEKGEQETV